MTKNRKFSNGPSSLLEIRLVLYFHFGSLTFIPDIFVKFIGPVQNDKRNYINFLIVNFPFICSNIPAVPSYEVYISRFTLSLIYK